MRILTIIVSAMMCVASFGQSARVEFQPEQPTPKEWKKVNWKIVAVDDGDIIAYSMLPAGKLLLTRFNEQFEIKASSKTTTQWYLIDAKLHGDQLDVFCHVDGWVTYYCFDAKTLKLKQQKDLFKFARYKAGLYSNGKPLGKVRYVVRWSENAQYVGVAVFAHQYENIGGSLLPQRQWVESELHLYDAELTEIAHQTADEERFPKKAAQVAFYPGIEVTNDGTLFYKGRLEKCLFALSADGWKQFSIGADSNTPDNVRLGKSRIVEKNGDNLLMLAYIYNGPSYAYNYNLRTQTATLLSTFDIDELDEPFTLAVADSVCHVCGRRGGDDVRPQSLLWFNADYTEAHKTAYGREGVMADDKDVKSVRLWDENGANMQSYFYTDWNDTMNEFTFSRNDGKLYRLFCDFGLNSDAKTCWWLLAYSHDGDVATLNSGTIPAPGKHTEKIGLDYYYVDANHILLWQQHLGANAKKPTQRIGHIVFE